MAKIFAEKYYGFNIFFGNANNSITKATNIVSLEKPHRHKTLYNFTEHCVRFSVVVGNNRITVTLQVVTSIVAEGCVNNFTKPRIQDTRIPFYNIVLFFNCSTFLLPVFITRL